MGPSASARRNNPAADRVKQPDSKPQVFRPPRESLTAVPPPPINGAKLVTKGMLPKNSLANRFQRIYHPNRGSNGECELRIVINALKNPNSEDA